MPGTWAATSISNGSFSGFAETSFSERRSPNKTLPRTPSSPPGEDVSSPSASFVDRGGGRPPSREPLMPPPECADPWDATQNSYAAFGTGKDFAKDECYLSTLPRKSPIATTRAENTSTLDICRNGLPGLGLAPLTALPWEITSPRGSINDFMPKHAVLPAERKAEAVRESRASVRGLDEFRAPGEAGVFRAPDCYLRPASPTKGQGRGLRVRPLPITPMEQLPLDFKHVVEAEVKLPRVARKVRLPRVETGALAVKMLAEEMTAATAMALSTARELRKARPKFEQLDLDGNGTLEGDELSGLRDWILKMFVDPSNDKCLDAGQMARCAAALMVDADADGDGVLTFEEFGAWYARTAQKIAQENVLRDRAERRDAANVVQCVVRGIQARARWPEAKSARERLEEVSAWRAELILAEVQFWRESREDSPTRS